MNDCTEQSFLHDVADHEMIVLLDDGVYRHIRFKRPNTGCMYFDIITWPGYLCYTGDMGCYVFSRLNDMFEFFRADREHGHLKEGQTLAINLGYWSEKLTAIDSQGHYGGKAVEFNADRFRSVINEYRISWMREYRDQLSKAERRELWEAVEDEVLNRIDDLGEAVQHVANDFSWGSNNGSRFYHFDSLWDHNFTQLTYRFTWCCYALAWGILKYDEAKTCTSTDPIHA